MNQTHGLSDTPEYLAWCNMRQRCGNPQHPQYSGYGGRGISVFPEWQQSFTAFLRDLGPRPSPDYTLDRYPSNDGNYEPGNVRWAVRLDQMRNMRRNCWIEFSGRRMVLTDWAKEIGISIAGLQRRLQRYPVAFALTMKTIPQALIRADRKIQTHCLRGHEFTIENTRYRKGNKRSCRACDALHHKRETERRAR